MKAMCEVALVQQEASQEKGFPTEQKFKEEMATLQSWREKPYLSAPTSSNRGLQLACSRKGSPDSIS